MRKSLTFDDFVGQVLDYAIIALDVDGVIRTWNAGAEKLKGYRSHEAIGRSFDMFYSEEDRSSGLPYRLLADARTRNRVEHTGWRVRKDGTRFWGDVVITALHDDAGAVTGYAKVTRDLTEKHELERALRESEERFRLLVGQVVDHAIVALDPAGLVQTWNLGAERLHSRPAHAALGESFAVFYAEEDRAARVPDSLLEVARHRGRAEYAGWQVRQDGSRFWAEVVLTSLHDEDGGLTGYAVVTRDRSDLKALEEAQQAFYATFDHDFRTPITALKGYIEALRDVEDPSDRSHMIDRLQATCERLQAMVEGLVEFATGHAAQASLVLGEIDVAQVTRDAVSEVSPHLDPGQRVRVGNDVAIARGNGVAMHRVVTNLVTNALKYSGVDAPVEVTFSTPRADRLRMCVSDRGRGIDAADLESIFDEFNRGRLARDDGGTGLGLASVRELVDLQGGQVWIESELGVGTQVLVELQATRTLRPDAPAPRSAAGSLPQASGSGAPTGSAPTGSTPTGQSAG